MMEALVCHPLDTIKVRMQLSRRARQPGAPRRGFVKTGADIVRKETPLGLYKGLGAVLTGIVPKMAIRFTSFESYKQMLADKQTGVVSGKMTFLAGLAAGVTEAVAVVTPMEVVKIRLQAQHHSMADPLDIPKYRNAGHAVYSIVREEGAAALYRGVSLTALRQATNQGASPVTPPAPPVLHAICSVRGRAGREQEADARFPHGRRELHRIPGAQEARAPAAARAERPALVPAHGHRPRLGRDGPLHQRAHRHHQDPCVPLPFILSHLPDLTTTAIAPTTAMTAVTATTTTATAGLQKAEAAPGQSAFRRIAAIAAAMRRDEGARAFYKIGRAHV